jgi:putative addiction module component (TIGR02574 family)
MTHAELTELPVGERLKLMEDLWDTLHDVADAVPGWHEEVLAARAKSLDQGSESVSDWQEAKERLRRQAARQ